MNRPRFSHKKIKNSRIGSGHIFSLPITKDDAQPLIDSGEAEVIPTQWIHTDRNEVLRLQGGVDVPEDLKSRLVACGQFEKADVR